MTPKKDHKIIEVSAKPVWRALISSNFIPYLNLLMRMR